VTKPKESKTRLSRINFKFQRKLSSKPTLCSFGCLKAELTQVFVARLQF